jgi:hypothetical protein
MHNDSGQRGFFKLREHMVFDKDVSDAEFRTYCALGIYADHEGNCWPAEETIAKRLGRARSTVAEHIAALRKKKRLRSVRRKSPDGRYFNNLYRLNLGPLSAVHVGSADVAMSAQPTLTRPEARRRGV